MKRFLIAIGWKTSLGWDEEEITFDLKVVGWAIVIIVVSINWENIYAFIR